jgi:hypothetical protein
VTTIPKLHDQTAMPQPSLAAEHCQEPARRFRSNRSDAVRVASIPASQVYVRHLASIDGRETVLCLADPIPADGRKVPGGWWPPVMLDRHWLTNHAADYDLAHLQFGFDGKTPAGFSDVVDCLRSPGKPLVYTVNDLRNPHHPDRRAHDA